jgi:signal transduction histidine kinase
MSGAEDTSTGEAARDAADAPAPAAAPRGRLFRKYALLFIALVGAALLVTSGFDLWFSYRENKAALVRVQQEKAQAAAARIEEFIGEIERQIGWTTHAQWAAAPLDQRRQDYFRLQRQVPAITELTELDGQGREQLTVSRLKMDVIGSEADFSQTPAFKEAKAHRLWFSPVYFRKQSEPYMTLAIARDGRNAGVTIAEINLKLIWDVVTALKIGEQGYAYVVDGRGKLIAHPDISLVLRDTDLSRLPQVASALPSKATLSPSGGEGRVRGSSSAHPAATVARNLTGRAVLTAHAPIQPLGWLVFVEVPLREAFAPLYGAAMRTLFLLAAGLVAAALVALILARRMTGPIRAIAAGAERLGMGELDRRIEVHTGDELEALAGQFNRMAGDLQKSYAELEQRVRDRTAELSETLDQQTATAEVLGVINSSPGDLAPVFDAMLEKAIRLCAGAQGVLWTYDGARFRPAAMSGVTREFAEFLNEPGRPGASTPVGRIAHGEAIVHIVDLAADQSYHSGEPLPRAAVEIGGIRTIVVVALVKDESLLGAFAIYRQEVRPFTGKQIELLQNFAAQAVIAMENARLITETREALEQQTATAEVLGVINASPGDLAPVFGAILEKAHTLCGAEYGSLQIRDGEYFRAAAVRGLPEAFANRLREGFRPSEAPLTRGLLDGVGFVQLDDLAQIEHPVAQAGFKLGGLRTALAIPLRHNDVLLGMIVAGRREVRRFSDKQIALLQNFAAQAVIAMENARLITETREALEQQTATAEVLGVINSSSGDLAPVFDAMLDKALDLCSAAFGVFWTYDGEFTHAAAIRGATAAYREFLSAPHRPGPGSAQLRLIQGERFVHVADLADSDDYRSGDALPRALVDLGGGRSLLAAPLRKDGAYVGAIMIYRQQPSPFSDKQIALLENFAAQAVIAMENARLITETREALEQQTATAEVLGVINSSPGDLTPVFEAILEKAHILCEAAHGHLTIYDGESFRIVAMHGVDAVAPFVTQPFSAEPSSLQERLLHGERLIHIPDIASIDAIGSKNVRRQAAIEAGFHTVIFVALRKDEVLVGYITAYRQEVRPFSDKQIALLQNFAAQAVIAMENARLLGELRSRTDELGRSVEELKALSEVGQEVSSTLDLRGVLSTILNRSVDLSGADAGAIFRYRRADRTFRFVEAVGYTEAMAQDVRALDVGENVTGLGIAIANRAPLQIPDLRERPPNPLRDRAVAAGFRSVLIVPLVGADRIMGATVLQRRAVGEFPEAMVRLMQTLAAQSVLAIQNARLFREINEKSEELRLASQHKSQFLANMSHELRTPLNAILGYAELLADGIYGELAPRAAGVLERVQNNGRHLLALINDVLDLAKIEAGQLALTLEDYALPDVVQSVVSATESLANNKGLKFTADIMPGLPPGHGDARRLAQVLLNLTGNAIKFTDAGEVAIDATAADGNFVLTVRDTGPGIAPEDQGKIFEEFQQVDNSNTRKKGGTGLGLAISKRMVEMQGGTISVESEPGQGATFRVRLPIRVEHPAEELLGAAE